MLSHQIRRLLFWWAKRHPDRTLEACIPAYRDALRRERRARARNDCQAIGRAVQARKAALHAALAGKGA